MQHRSATAQGDDVALLAEASEQLGHVEQALKTVVVGQDAVVRALLTAVLADGHVLLIGVPGLAKTLLVRSLALAMDWQFGRIQFTPDMMPADVIGTELLQDDPSTGQRRMQFMPGPIFTNLLLADEINRTPPKTQSALLEAMQEYTVTSMGRTHELHRPFIVVATQNPIEQQGTYPLPEAQLDRFMFSLTMRYPDAAAERAVVMQTTGEPAARIGAQMTREHLIAAQHLVRRMPLSEHVADLAVHIARATRPEQGDDFIKQNVSWGAGTRAAQAMVLAGKAMALLEGEPTVNVLHIRAAAHHVLHHRVLPSFAAVGEGITTSAIIDHVLKRLPQ
jgi:MoxR-like ATPase